MFNVSKAECIPVIQYENIRIDPKCRTVIIDNSEKTLYPKEFDLLYFFAKHPGWVFSKEQIYEHVYGEESSIEINNTIYCLIRGLRDKIEKDRRHPEYIQTVRGVGYKFLIPDE